MIAAAAAIIVLQAQFPSEAPLAITDIKVEPPAPVIWEPVEVSFQFKGTWSNVFDSRQVFVTADLAGQNDLFAEVPGFVYEPPNGWRVRFAPWSTGKFSIALTGFDTLGRVNVKKFEFNVKKSERPFPGFIETKDKLRYFQRSDGKAQFLFGPRVANLTEAKKAWDDGANCVTFDLSPLTGKLNLQRFNEIDVILNAGLQADKYVTFVIGSDVWLKDNWQSNPFFEKGKQPESFFQSLQARLAYKRYLKYFIGRTNAYPSMAGIILWEGDAPDYWLEEMMVEVRALHPFAIPVLTNPTEIDWLREPWLRSSLVPFQLLKDFHALEKKPIAIVEQDVARALSSGAAAAIGAKAEKGIAEFANLFEWNKRNFDFRVVSGETANGRALIDDNGGAITIGSTDQVKAGTVALSIKKNGKYTCTWFNGGAEVTKTTAQSKDSALELPHPPFSGTLLGFLKRD